VPNHHVEPGVPELAERTAVGAVVSNLLQGCAFQTIVILDRGAANEACKRFSPRLPRYAWFFDANAERRYLVTTVTMRG
jgi:hypothetical protein